VAQGPSGYDPVTGYWATIEKYSLTGDLLGTYSVAANSASYSHRVPNLDLAPDQCTVYYDTEGGNGIYRFNVCTGTQECPLVLQAPGCVPTGGTNGDPGLDQLRILPNWDVVETGDCGAVLSDAAGGFIRGWPCEQPFTEETRWVSLDPNGTSLRVGSYMAEIGPPCGRFSSVWQLDMNTGQLLTTWHVSCGTGAAPGGIAADSPPLLGDANVEGTADSHTAGTAAAFQTTVGYSGQLTHLHVWVDSSSTASQAVVGVYSDKNGRPDSLQTQATIGRVRPGSWNYVDVPSVPVVAGQRYWIAVLGPKGGGAISFRDAGGGAPSEVSAQPNLSALPAQWSGAAHRGTAGLLSAYGS
jgi:hypothetical protein